MVRKKSLYFIIAWLVIITLLATTVTPFNRVYASPEDDYKWFDNGSVVTISEYTGTDTDLTIPDTLDGKRVISIGNYAFEDKNLTSVKLPDGITSIELSAFAKNQLTKVTIPDTVTSINSHAFANNELVDVTIPNGVTGIGDGAFSENKLTQVELPDSITSIGSSAFYNNQLTEVTIPDGVTTIGNMTFSDNKLISVKLPDNLTDIGDNAFTNNQLTEIAFPNSIESIGFAAFLVNQLTHVEISDSVTSIGDIAFSQNELVEVKLPDGITSIENGVFSNNQLESITIPDSVTSIEGQAFYNNKLVSVVIPNHVTSIGSNAFAHNKLTNIEIPDSITSIAYGVFSSNSLRNVKVPDSVTEIGSEAFAYNELANVTIPNSVISIGRRAFVSNKLTNVEIPDSITRIEYETFADNELTNATIPNSVTSIGSRSFVSNKLTNIEIPDSVTSIESEAFADNELTNVVIPDSITSIEGYAFVSNNLTSVQIPNDSVTFGTDVFLFNPFDEQFYFDPTSYDPSNLTIIGNLGSSSESYANAKGHNFVAFDSSPTVEIQYEGKSVSEELSIDYQKKGTLKAIYGHDFAKITKVTWEVNGKEVGSNDTLSLDSYTDRIGEITINLIVETEYGGVSSNKFALVVNPPEQTVAIPDKQVYQLDKNSTLVIDDLTGDTRHVHFNQDQIQYLKKQNATIQVQKGDVILSIPAVVLSGKQSVTLTMDSLDKGSVTLPGSSVAVGAIYDFTLKQGNKDESYFEHSITIGFPVQGHENSEELQVYYWNEDTKEWELIGGEYKDGYIHATTNHFSTFAVFHPDELAEQTDKNSNNEVKEVVSNDKTNKKQKNGGMKDEDNNQSISKKQNKEAITDQNKETLPKTATSMFNFILLGIALFLLGGLTYFLYRRLNIKTS